MLVGVLLYKILPLCPTKYLTSSTLSWRSKKPHSSAATKKEEEKSEEEIASIVLSFWLLNPFSIIVSTRGNAETLVSLLVLLCLYFLFVNRIFLAAIVYGFAVHFKIYPIIYCLAFWLFISPNGKEKKGGKKKNRERKFYAILQNFFNIRRLKFGVISAITFISISWMMYLLYGYEYLYESYFYHVIRTDHRHNFSFYFYYLYLTSQDSSKWVGIVLFIPQLLVLFGFPMKYFAGADSQKRRKVSLVICMFLQTLCFVIFNKVCTAQYFIWYMSLLPLVIPYLTTTLPKFLFLAGCWLAAKFLWLHHAYKLEFMGENTFSSVWVCSLLFFVANLCILVEVMLSCRNFSLSKPKAH